MAQSPPSTAGFPPRAGVLTLLRAGRQAFAQVPGLRGFVLRGFLLNYAVFVLVTAVVMGLGYVLLVQPLSAHLLGGEAGPGFWAGLMHALAQWLAWIAAVLLMAATLLVAVVLSLALLSLWFEALAGRIVTHWRGTAAGPAFAWGPWLSGTGRALADGLGLLLLALLALLLGFLPLVGPLLVVLVNSVLLGREVRDPYVNVRRALGDDDLPGAWRHLLWTGRLGLLPFLLAAVPVLGWLLLPITLITLVAGVAWEGERMRARALGAPAR
ncbi:MAG: EI24 domain-containing protein [Candidatus Lambdaproteobacteria bacterium]|nr:EI24 domain-containing protein [Candidatus Lambdaproteobacteria bacterium]